MKKIFYHLPKLLRQLIVQVIEFFAWTYTKSKSQDKVALTAQGGKKNILIYHVSALSFGGTEKNLQMIAKHLDRTKYNVFLMHATATEKNRLSYLKDVDLNIIPFTHDSIAAHWPYLMKGMSPSIEEVVSKHQIDAIITATPGQTIFPLINIRTIPIILINIFGSFTMQKNIRTHICISKPVHTLAARVVDEDRLEVQYIPSERPMINDEKAKHIRDRFGISQTDLVFGRIGRNDDSIFDPIGLLAFSIAVQANPHMHYIIMSGPSRAKDLVRQNTIPNVHWLEASYEEGDVWAFHQAIDVLAHFRKDGESFGLNIAESMLVGNPILTHKSPIWNAHLEYLENSFSRVAEQDDYKQYAQNMIEFANIYRSGKLKVIGQIAKEKGEKLFLIENSIKKYEALLDKEL